MERSEIKQGKHEREVITVGMKRKQTRKARETVEVGVTGDFK
ncbi:hypothetical protein [Lentibacillus sp. CBA3610]|nr:hypothetical protein [Lentibacillus sp. CBA3610]